MATLTAKGVMVGNGTSSPTFVSPGAAGNILQSNGTDWVPTAFTGVNYKYAIFSTAGTANWVAPTGVTMVKVTVVGGGGGSSYATCFSTWGIGGNGGNASGYYAVTPGSSYSYTVGASGTGLTYSGCGSAYSGSGGTSSFAGVLSATGGSGGDGSTGGSPGATYASGSGSGSAYMFASQLKFAYGAGGQSPGANGSVGYVLIEYIGA